MSSASVPSEPGQGVPESVLGDSTLVRYMRTGEEHAAEELYRRYASRLRKIISLRSPQAFSRRFDPDDIVQSVFRVFYERIQANQYEVPKSGEIWSLLFVIAINKLRHQISHHKAAKRNIYRTAGAENELNSALIHSDLETSAVLKIAVEDYLAKLNEPDRAIVCLRMTGHSIAEIAQTTGRAVRTVERVLQKSRDDLTSLIQS